MDQGKGAVASCLEKGTASIERCTETGESSEAARPRKRILLNHGSKENRLIIRQLPDRGFKSRPRNQISIRRLDLPPRSPLGLYRPWLPRNPWRKQSAFWSGPRAGR